MAETVKLEVPDNLVKAAELLVPFVNMDTREIMIRAIQSDIEGMLGNYGPDMEMDKVPLYLNPCRYAWLTWWYSVLAKRKGYDDISGFLLACVRPVIDPYVETLTYFEHEELARIEKSLGIPEESPLKTEILQLIKTS